LALEELSRDDLARCARCRARFYPSGIPVGGRTSGRAIASFILGLSTLFIPLVPTIPAVVLGVLALRDIRRAPHRLRGRETAMAGIVCAIILGVLQTLGAVGMVMTIGRNAQYVTRPPAAQSAEP
jgi:hypothetical protein